MADPIAESALRKVRWRLIPFLFLLYIVAYLDRVNVGFAAIDMNRDLGFSAAVYGLGSGIFFLSYTLLEVPSNLMLARARRPRVDRAHHVHVGRAVDGDDLRQQRRACFYLLRFLLGAAEAGFFPGIIFYLTHWFPARERARAVGAVHDRDGDGRRDRRADLERAAATGRRLRTARMAVAVSDRRPAGDPARAGGLDTTDRTPERCDVARRPPSASGCRSEMAAEQAQTAGAHVTFAGRRSQRPPVGVSLLYFCIVIAFYGISFWLPQIVQSTSGLGSATIVLLSAIPYVAATVGLVIVGTRSDRTGERRWHVAVPCLIGAAGFVLTVLVPATLAIALITLSIAAFGIWGTLGPFWTLPTVVPARHRRGRRHCAREFDRQRRRVRRALLDGLDPRRHRRIHRRAC